MSLKDHIGRKPVTESYWQQGCNDAKAGKPIANWIELRDNWDREARGYLSGYSYGRRLAYGQRK